MCCAEPSARDHLVDRAVRNLRRAYNADGSVIAPMDLANMRVDGVRSVEARCEACGHEAVVN